MSLIYNTSFWQTYGIKKPLLNCLVNDAEFYDTIIYQPKFNLTYSESFLRIVDEQFEEAKAKFMSFLALSSARSDLAITPEYSCPWEVLKNALEQKIFPKINSLWVLGCASIQASELKSFVEEIEQANKDIVIIYEKDKVNENLDNKRFFDPACLIFRTKSAENDVEKIVVIIQFKTRSFGGKPSIWEMEGLITGESIYIIENNDQNSIRLFTIICSDSLQNLDFNNALYHYQALPYFIIHIQLNTSPFQINYCKHRRGSFQEGKRQKDFLSVNWARSLTIKEEFPWNSYGGTAFYSSTEYNWNLDDQRLNHNHHHGIYYNYWPTFRAQLYFFNYDEYVFYFRNTKTSRESAPAEHKVRPGGVLANDSFFWHSGDQKWVSAKNLDDGFLDACKQVEEDFGDLSCIKNSLDKMNVERLVVLSAGKIEDTKWFTPQKLFSFQVNENEINSRITFTQDPEENQIERRLQLLMRYAKLKNVILASVLPEQIQGLSGNVVLQYDGSKSKFFNLHPKISGSNVAPALGIYIGINSRQIACKVLDHVIKLTGDSNVANRIFIWYSAGEDKPTFVAANVKSTITKNNEKSQNAINSTRK